MRQIPDFGSVLTYGSNGVYYEAGFAQALGKAVGFTYLPRRLLR